jgi:glycosyltransferase involved in cell wall biosynthesis
MRILMVSPYPGLRGPMPKLTTVLVEALISLGCDVVMEPWGRHRDHESIADKVTGRSVDVLRIRRRLRTERFDAMVVMTSHEARSLLRDLPLLLETRRRVPKIVVQFHGGRSDLLVAQGHLIFKAASAALFGLCDGVLVLSSEEARESQQFWRRGRFRVVANPYVSSEEDHAFIHDTNRTGDRKPSLLFVGRLIREKGIFEILTAFAAVSEHRECTLVIVGDGPDAAELARRVADLRLDEKITLTGFLSGGALRDAYRAADVFVLPSYHPEGFPTVITEAMTAGLPIVTTKIRGMADRLDQEKNALFVEPHDPSGLTAALERILADDELRRRMSMANRTEVAQFAPEPVARQYLEVLTELVERQESGAK